MLRRQNLGTLLLLGLAAEVVAFVAVVDWIGAGPAVLLGIGSTLLGLSRLRHIGTASLSRLRAAAAGHPGREDGFADGALDTAGAVLLILPGFLSDLAGLALMAPSCRTWVMGRLGLRVEGLAGSRAERVGRSAGPQTIDLQAGDWSRVERVRPK